jgi:nitrogen fixation/metabolism regulation signal transduction histidine kinase
MNFIRRNISTPATWAVVLVMLTLTACGPLAATPPPAPNEALVLATSAEITDHPIAAATITAVHITPENKADKAAATAKVVRANAQATLDSANATVSAAQTQDQSNANVIAAQIAATAEIVRSEAQATLAAADATRSAALTQDAIQQTQEEYNFQVTLAAGTQSVVALMTQQNKNDLAAGTGTSVANNIATQTQAAAATSQWYADQSKEQRQIPIAFLWMWCLPIFIVLLAGLVLWGVWRWLKIQQANERNPKNPVEKLQAPAAEVIYHQQDDALPGSESNAADSRYQLTKPEDPVRRWLDEVKRKLINSDKRDEDDDTDN